MASIQPITLTITRIPNSADVEVFVSYEVSSNGDDLETEQNYREVCQLIGDDTPGDGTDDVLHTLTDFTTFFTGTSTNFPRNIRAQLPASMFDEDSGPPIQNDEIRARVTMTPIPASRESNLVRFGGSVIGPG